MNIDDVDDTQIAEVPPYVQLTYFHNHGCSHENQYVTLRSYTENGAHIKHTVICTESGLELSYIGMEG